MADEDAEQPTSETRSSRDCPHMTLANPKLAELIFAGEGGGLHLTFDPRRAALLVRLDPVMVGGAVATVAPQQGIDEGLTDKLAVEGHPRPCSAPSLPPQEDHQKRQDLSCTEESSTDGSSSIPCRNDNGAWLNAAEDHVPGSGYAGPSAGLDVEMTPCMALEDVWS